MKFRSITLNNFMRYRGETTLQFSCDEKKNVSVVLGDNTFGKTTLAQAFRWGLFEELASTNYAKKGEIVLLNYDVISTMSLTTNQRVKVEIVVEDDGDIIMFQRSAIFRRKSLEPSNMSIAQVGDTSLVMQITRNGVVGQVINNNGSNSDKNMKKGCVQDKINSMLPAYLSNYFFFDGERWSDTKNSKKEIKQAIETILGITGFIALKNHLKDAPYNNVNRQLSGQLQSSGVPYETVKNEINELSKRLVALTDAEEEAKQSLKEAEEQCELRERRLDEFKDEEQNIKDFRKAEADIEKSENLMRSIYSDAVREFSKSAARYFASGLLGQVNELFGQIDLNGKDIPGITTDTVDYLLKEGRCLCGEELIEGGKAYQSLITLRKQIPPEMIGGAAGKFKELLEGWEYDTTEVLETLDRKQDDFDDAFDDKARASTERDSLSRKMNKNVDVKALRRAVDEARRECRNQDSRLSQIQGEIKFIRQDIVSKTQQLETLASKNEHNEKIKRAIGYTNEIYDTACRYAKRAQDHILEDLNEIISRNFSAMFQDTEKYAKLEEDYKVHVYYRDTNVEETVLSNGEATAVNFVYIVSILELARQRSETEKQETTENDIGSGILRLPLVLDGPFSALSNGNTNLVAKKLPSFAEQVIIFMMDKDWEASGLGVFTGDGFSYHIVKEDKAVSSTIEQRGGVN